MPLKTFLIFLLLILLCLASQKIKVIVTQSPRLQSWLQCPLQPYLTLIKVHLLEFGDKSFVDLDFIQLLFLYFDERADCVFRVNNFRLDFFNFARRVPFALEELPFDHLIVFCPFDAWLFEYWNYHWIASQSTGVSKGLCPYFTDELSITGLRIVAFAYFIVAISLIAELMLDSFHLCEKVLSIFDLFKLDYV